MKNISILFVLVLGSIFISSCGDDDSVSTLSDLETLKLNINGLEDLGQDFVYEGWIIVDGSPVTTGIFTVNASGELSETEFVLDKEDLDRTSAFVLTIEPSPDPDPAPSAVHILAGDFNGSTAADLSVGHGAALADDFTSAKGDYILATPTDGSNDTDEKSGVWWLDLAAGPGAGLDLPELPQGWEYEGWAVVDGQPLSTGKFTSVTGSDDFNGFSGNAGGPPFPGEDLLNNAPAGLDFPVDLSGRTVAISIEPSPDNSAAPFVLKPLVGAVPADALDHTVYGMSNNALNTNPTGSINIKL